VGILNSERVSGIRTRLSLRLPVTTQPRRMGTEVWVRGASAIMSPERRGLRGWMPSHAD